MLNLSSYHFSMNTFQIRAFEGDVAVDMSTVNDRLPIQPLQEVVQGRGALNTGFLTCSNFKSLNEDMPGKRNSKGIAKI